MKNYMGGGPGDKDKKNLALAKKYSDTHKSEMSAQAAQGARDEEAQFNTWADQVESGVGNGYKMDRGYVRDNGYRDPKTGQPYTAESATKGHARKHSQAGYRKEYSNFYKGNNMPVNGQMYREADAAFEAKYPRSANTQAGGYVPLKAGEAVMSMDPSRFQTQRNSYIQSQAVQNQAGGTVPRRKKGGLLYKK